MRATKSGVIPEARSHSITSSRFLRAASAVGAVMAIALGLTLAGPASAQLRGGDVGRQMNIGPRSMSPGGFGMRLDPTFRVTPGNAAIDSGAVSSGGGSTTTRKVHKTPKIQNTDTGA